MNTLKYKGYIGSIRFNDEEGLFSGRIEGIDSLIRFEGSSIQELTEAFHKAVDDYLDFCKKEGIPSKKSYSGTLNIRISPATHNSIADFAAEEGITINAFIKRALEKAVQNPADIIKSLVDGYDHPAKDTASCLCSRTARYGSRDIAQFWIPSDDIPFAKAMATRMGWDFMVNFPQSGLEKAMEEVREGKVSEYSSFRDMLKHIKEEDGEV